MKRLGLLLLCVLIALTGCDVLEVSGTPVKDEPALQLLVMPPYADEEAEAEQAAGADSHLRVDLWLDASQLMGGVNENEESLYPHASRKYREGGFHYRYGSTVGWYENVLQDMLAAAGDARVRVLRAGNERLTDQFLWESGFAAVNEDVLRSLRRDMLTCAINPMPDLFTGFSAESMEDSFYSLGSPQLNQMARFMPDDGAELENPGMTAQMNAALNKQIAAFENGAGYALSAVRDDQQSPLCYALENIALDRLSVITCDPATLRRLSGTTADGAPVDYITALLRERGVFDAGLKATLYALRLDYIGQMISFGSADFSDPLIWGRLDYNNKTNQPIGELPMPRIALALVVGKPSQVDGYTAALNLLMNSDGALRGLRGPVEGQLSYTANSQTVTQQPFGFSYEYTDVERPDFGYYTQHTDGMTLTLPMGGGEISEKNGLTTVSLTGDGEAVCRLSWPAAALGDGMSLDLTALTNVKTEVIDSLLFSGTLTNTPDAVVPEGAQAVKLRDKLYLYTRQTDKNPFAVAGIALSEDQATLQATVTIDGGMLKPGYYRVRVYADASGAQLSWPAVGWTEDVTGLSVEISNGQITAWESFSNVLTRYARDEAIVPKQFNHAWGSYNDKGYEGVAIPDFPPVYRALHLSRLFTQLRSAALVDTAPYIRCVFDVFVPNH